VNAQNDITLRDLVDRFDISLTSHREEERREALREFRIRSAERVLEALEEGNVGLIADTGTGKTIVALLVFLFLYITQNSRTLFLAPQRILTKQHKKLFSDIMRQSHVADSEKIVGGTKKRRWNDKKVPIIFATPQTFMNGIRKGVVDMTTFDLVVFDEFHRTTGKYAYVYAVDEAWKTGIQTLHLSASPGGTKEKIEKIEKTCHIKTWVREKVAMPRKIEVMRIARQDDILQTLDQKFLSLFDRLHIQFRQFGILEKEPQKTADLQGELFDILKTRIKKIRVLSQNELDVIAEKAQKLPFPNPRYEALSLYGIYGKLRYSYLACMEEGYATFLSFIERTQKKDGKRQEKRKCSRPLRTSTYRFLSHPRVREIVEIAERERDNHPKTLLLLDTLREYKKGGRSAIVFVGEKETGKYLKEILKEQGVVTEVLFGGKGKNIRRQEAAIKGLKHRELDFVITTSVVKEGLNVPEIDGVVHYSLPQNECERIQGNGRSGRTKEGYISYIILDHPIEQGRYWSSFHKLKKMNEVIEEKTSPHFMFGDERIKGSLVFSPIPAFSEEYNPAYK